MTNLHLHAPLRRGAMILSIAGAVLGCGSSGESGPVTPTGPQRAAVASVVVTPSSSAVAVGTSVQFTATVRDATGATLTDRAVTWTVADGSKASITTAGLVTGLVAGTTSVTATSEGVNGTAAITVSAPLPVNQDFAITGVQFTQAVQDATGSIPMIVGGNAAAVNVLLTASTPSSVPMQVVLRLFNAAGTVVRTDTALTTTIGTTASYTSPSVQFLVPPAVIQAGLRWQVQRDPRGLVKDDAAANDVFPASGTQALATAAPPPLEIRFVPIILAANGGSTPTISTANIPEYLRTLRSVHPLGQNDAHIGEAFTTQASFGTGTSGGEATFWQQLIAELDVARLAHPTESTINWYGVVSPPPGFTFTSFGGFSYIPGSNNNTGPNTRTSSGVRIGWFSRATQARDLVAHELGHTFGRRHTPCGGPTGIDLSYPVPTGTLDVAGHDVYSWANGLATSAAAVSTNTGDVMGYCFPVWSSAYTYKAVLAFRTPTVLAARSDAVERGRVLLIRGVIRDGESIELAPAIALDARTSLPDVGSYLAEGLSADGRVLFSYRFEPAELDHAPNMRHFTLSVPYDAALEETLEAVRVRGAEGETVLRASTADSRIRLHDPARATAVRQAGNGLLSVSCGEGEARGTTVIDGQSGVVLATNANPSLRVAVAQGRPLVVLCSDGLRTRRATVRAP
jgi:hypothetical protein